VVSLMLASVPLASLVLGGTAAALAPRSVGYWVKGGASVPTVPAGGLLVGNDPTSAVNPASPVGGGLPVPAPNVPAVPGPTVTGPTAISAAQITGLSAGDVTLTLKVGAGSVVPPPSVTTIMACPLVNSWHAPPKGAGNISQAPAYNCVSGSTGKVAADNSTISWLLPASFQANPGEVDVALVPNPAGLPAAFMVSFDAPGLSSVVPSSGAPSTPVTAPASPPASVPAPAVSAPPVVAGSPSFTPSFAPALDNGNSGTAVAPPPSATNPSSASAPGASLGFGRLAGIRLPGDDRGHRLMAVLVLFAVAGGWWYAGSRPERAPRLLGALAGGSPDADRGLSRLVGVGRVGGVGRFSRPRQSGPRHL
jgi:hypothetical protein